MVIEGKEQLKLGRLAQMTTRRVERLEYYSNHGLKLNYEVGLSPALGRRGVAVCYSYISSPLRYGFQYTKASGIRFLIPEDTKVCRSVFILVELLKPRCALYSTMLVLLCADLLSSHSS